MPGTRRADVAGRLRELGFELGRLSRGQRRRDPRGRRRRVAGRDEKDRDQVREHDGRHDQAVDAEHARQATSTSTARTRRPAMSAEQEAALDRRDRDRDLGAVSAVPARFAEQIAGRAYSDSGKPSPRSGRLSKRMTGFDPHPVSLTDFVAEDMPRTQRAGRASRVRAALSGPGTPPTLRPATRGRAGKIPETHLNLERTSSLSPHEPRGPNLGFAADTRDTSRLSRGRCSGARASCGS